MHELNRVLIVEDSDEIVEAISLALQIRWPEVKVDAASSGEEGIRLAGRITYSLVILDLGLPDIGGFEVLKSIRLFSSVPILILTVRGEEADIVKGLELGADEYIVKPFRQLELLARIKALTRREVVMRDAEKLSIGSLVLETGTRTVYYKGKAIELTRTENSILEQLMRNAGSIVTYSRLSEAIWGDEFPDAAAALKVHISRLRHKLELEPQNSQLIQTKPGLGYFMMPGDAPQAGM